MWPRADELEDVSEHQREAARYIFTQPVAVLAGSAGTGKTHLAAAIVKAIVKRNGLFSTRLVCPTGKASVRLTQAMNSRQIRLRASTIHQALEIGRAGYDGSGWNFQRDADNSLGEQFIGCDEASMVPTDLAASLLSACAAGTHILFVGDPYQLPPVGHGAFLRDMMMSGVIPCFELREIHRQKGKDNLIIEAATAIRDGQEFRTCDKFDEDTGQNFRHIEIRDPELAIDTLVKVLLAFRDKGKFDPVWDCQVMCATNEKGPYNRRDLNYRLQAELNPTGQRSKKHHFRVGDKCICRENRMYRSAFDEPGAGFSQRRLCRQRRHRRSDDGR